MTRASGTNFFDFVPAHLAPPARISAGNPAVRACPQRVGTGSLYRCRASGRATFGAAGTRHDHNGRTHGTPGAILRAGIVCHRVRDRPEERCGVPSPLGRGKGCLIGAFAPETPMQVPRLLRQRTVPDDPELVRRAGRNPRHARRTTGSGRGRPRPDPPVQRSLRRCRNRSGRGARTRRTFRRVRANFPLRPGARLYRSSLTQRTRA